MQRHLQKRKRGRCSSAKSRASRLKRGERASSCRILRIARSSTPEPPRASTRPRTAGKTFQRMTDADVIVNDVYVDPRDSNRVLLATDRGGVLVSNDAGVTFTPSNQGISERKVAALLVDRNDPDAPLRRRGQRQANTAASSAPPTAARTGSSSAPASTARRLRSRANDRRSDRRRNQPRRLCARRSLTRRSRSAAAIKAGCLRPRIRDPGMQEQISRDPPALRRSTWQPRNTSPTRS